MKKLTAILLAFTTIFSLCACQKEGNESQENEVQTTAKLDPTVYPETSLKGVKTFTEITSIELLSSNKDNLNNTEYTYFIAENADNLVYQYQEYLREIGFVMSSTNHFTLENAGSINIKTEEVENGKNIVISVPCDDKTAQARKESTYKKVEEAFNKKDYSTVLKMDSSFGSELRDYKDYKYYYNYSMGIISWEAGVWGYAYTYFSECSDKADVNTYLDQISKYTGQYKCHVTSGVFEGSDNYIFINNGDVALETDSNYSEDFMEIAGIDPNDKYDMHYNYPDPVTMMLYDLVVTTNDDGSPKMTIDFVEYKNDGTFEFDSKYEFIDNKDGTYTLKELDESYNKLFEGVYTKISDTPSPGA